MVLPPRYRLALMPLSGGLIGLFAWGHSGLTWLTLLAFLPLLWGLCQRRHEAFLLICAYYLASGRGLITGTPAFFGPDALPGAGILLWLGASLLLALPYVILWHPALSQRQAALRWLIALGLVTLPPLGLIGWTSPWTISGAAYPGWGIAGAILGGLLMAALAARAWKTVALAASMAAMANLSYLPPPLPPHWQASDTALGLVRSQTENPMQAFERHQHFIAQALALEAGQNQLWPETTLGLWGPASINLWSQTQENLANRAITVFIGAEYAVADQVYDNVLLSIGKNQSMYRQRVPVPISMWRPWSPYGARARLLGSGVMRVQTQAATSAGWEWIGVVLCYEQLIPWTLLGSLAPRVSVLLAPANAWWAGKTSIPAVQQTTTRSWARLFHTPVLFATNR